MANIGKPRPLGTKRNKVAPIKQSIDLDVDLMDMDKDVDIPEIPEVIKKEDKKEEKIEKEESIDSAARIISKRKVDEEAEAVRNARKIPPVPGKVVTYEQMKEWLDRLTPDMWSHVLIYVYRVYPKIIRQLVDPNASNNIDVISEPFTIQTFTTTHGGGKYKFIVGDTDLKKHTQIMEARLDISINESLPIINYKELDINSKDNEAYIRLLYAKGITDEKGRVVNNQNQNFGNSGSGSYPPELFNMMRDMLKTITESNRGKPGGIPEDLAAIKAIELAARGGEKAMDMMLAKFHQEDPSKQVEMLTNLLNAIKAGKGDDSSSNMMMTVMQSMMKMQSDGQASMMKIQMDAMNMQMKFMDKITELATSKHVEGGEGSKTDDDIDRFSKLLNLARMIKGGGSGDSEKPWWADLIGIVPPVMNNLGTIIKGAMALRAGGGMGGGIAGVNPLSQPTGEQSQQLDGIEGGREANMNDPDDKLRGALIQYGNLILNALNQGKQGYELAADVVSLLGLQTHGAFASVGVEKLVSVAKSTPPFWEQAKLFGEARVMKFIKDFVEFNPERDYEGEVEGTTNPDGGGNSPPSNVTNIFG